MNRLFESKGIADLYVKYRPHTPKCVREEALKFLKKRSSPKEEGKYSLLLDVGCGSGQSTKIWACDFKQVVGLDPSENQITQARSNNKLDNIKYMVGSGESFPFDDGSVDMVVAGQALHWFDFDKFFAECRRVLRADGCFFAFGYPKPRISFIERENDINFKTLKSESDDLILDFCDKKCHFDPRVRFLEDHYKHVFEIIPSSIKERNDDSQMVKVMTLKDFTNYISTFSGYHNHRNDIVGKLQQENSNMTPEKALEVYNEKHDIMKKFIQSLRKCWLADALQSNDDINVRVMWYVPMIMSARPDLIAK